MELRDHAQRMIAAALAAVDPAHAVRAALDLDGARLAVAERVYDLERVDRLLVVGCGKAALGMARAAAELLGDRLDAGCVIVPADQHRGALQQPPSPVAVAVGSHPLPDARSVAATEQLVALLRGAGPRDLVLVLLSGGGSALLTLPAAGVELDELTALNQQMLRAGMPIAAINTVRRHLSRIKGGGLLRLAAPASVAALVISDVIGSPLEAIASGPVSGDRSTHAEALELIARFELTPGETIGAHLQAGAVGRREETLSPSDPLVTGAHVALIADNRKAAEAALASANQLGYRTMLLSTFVEGEAREVGGVLGGVLRELATSGQPLAPPACIVVGGETTVTVRGRGRGGRNQELALAAALAIEGLRGVALVALATDGVDGPTDAAGAVVDGQSIDRARAAGLDPLAQLADNDAYTLLAASGDLLRPGPSGTNVNDLTLMLAGIASVDSR